MIFFYPKSSPVTIKILKTGDDCSSADIISVRGHSDMGQLAAKNPHTMQVFPSWRHA
jgi:hypothetical protein